MKTFRFILVAFCGLLAFAGCRNGHSSSTSGEARTSSSITSAAGPAAAVTAVPAGPAAEAATPVPVAADPGRLSPDEIVPEIHFLSKGSVLPSAGHWDLPFSATGYAKAQVRIRKVFTDNILQYMQNDRYEVRYASWGGAVSGGIINVLGRDRTCSPGHVLNDD